MDEVLLRLSNIEKSFGGVRALKGVSFELRAGEVHALVGENGAGKSTLIKIVAGAYPPDSGQVEIAGQTVVEADPRRAHALGVAVIYQQPSLFPDLSVAENLALGIEPPGALRRVRWRERRENAARLLGRVGAEFSPDAEVRDLSMPEQQLVEIARALGTDARIFIMDEPTSSLTEREVKNLFRAIRQLRFQKAGIVYISHRLEEIGEICDRVTALRDGAWVATKPVAEVDHAAVIRMMVGRELASVFPKVDAPIGPPVLELESLSCAASGFKDVSLEVRAGEILGLAGLVGAGRTELARTIFGIDPADSGSIRIEGKPVVISSPADAVACGIAYVPEDRRKHGVILDMSVAANATLAVLPSLSRGGLLARGAERALATDAIDRLGIKTPSPRTPAGDLSGGNQQKVALARWLATKPKVLILDEPTQGIDVGAKAEIHRLMGELAAAGMAIIMI
ncbi:MAG TPA: sugar ABC transporter ATP-binding protein, partial [Planctomycetia bacterium]|nr:sugar ABC transporter ATP-binding protein [Planctomycetia bacterium]